jgi:RHS repeat-associated protein
VETRTQGSESGVPAQLIRYQLSNHLGSASLELDDVGQLISYEEYYPYGSTSYQAVRSAAGVSLKRYRYTAMERDDETGFAYHSARYYSPWLGRWVSADPIGIQGGINLYVYCSGNPATKVDRSGKDEWCGLTDGFFGLFDSECHVAPRVAGGLKMVGGAMETTAGAAMTVVGGATCEFGFGCFIAAGGVVVTAHGIDTTVSGGRTVWNGSPVDSLSSQLMQKAGMSRNSANLVDAGVSIVGTLGANFATRAPAVAAEGINLTTPSISVSHAAGAPSALGVTNPLGYAVGHSRIGVTLGDGSATVWSHLTVPGERVMMSGGALVRSGEAVITTGTGIAPRFASVATVPVTAAEAQAALSLVKSSATAVSSTTSTVGSAGQYGFLVNDCATYAGSVFKAANVPASGATPSTLFLSAAVRSEAPLTTLLTSATTMQPITAAGIVTNVAVGATSQNAANTNGATSQKATNAKPGLQSGGR